MAKGLFDLTGKVAIVTGGNSGLGLGFARGLAKQGCAVAIWGRDAAKLDKARQELESYGVKVSARQVEVALEQEVIDGFKAAIEEFGRIDCAIANAGTSTVSPIIDMTTAMYDDMINVAQRGAFFTLREAGRHMVERAKRGDTGGALIACGSLSNFLANPQGGHYGAAKSAVAAMIRTLAVELGPYGIRANVISVGYVPTDLTRDNNVDLAPWHEKFIADTPLHRLGRVEDVEGAAAYLASDAASFHTGDTIVIDGGCLINL